MSRILWVGNAPWAPSGYGGQAALFLPRLRDQGHDVAHLCNFGLQGHETNWNGIPCYPSDDSWANLNLRTYAKHHDADQVIMLCDAWVLKPDLWDGLEVAVWAPVDHWPIPPMVLATLKHEQVTPIAMAKFGVEQMDVFDLDPLYVPHAVDTAIFRPEPGIKEKVREQLDIPQDVFLVGMVGANLGNSSIPRKSFPQALLAFNELARKHDDAWLYVHSNATPQPHQGGIKLDRLATVLGIPAGRLRFPHTEAIQLGIPSYAMAYIYQAFDVFLQPSMGEGFGIPAIEAQACGVPVILSDHSAMTELCGSGWLVQGDPWWDELQDSFFIMPHVRSIYDALELAYEHRDDQALRDRAVEFAAGYDADLVTERYWAPVIERLLTPAAPREVGPLPRLERKAAVR